MEINKGLEITCVNHWPMETFLVKSSLGVITLYYIILFSIIILSIILLKKLVETWNGNL